MLVNFHIPIVVATKYLNVIDKPVELSCFSLSDQIRLAGSYVSSARMFTRFVVCIDVSLQKRARCPQLSGNGRGSGGESGRPSARFKTPPAGTERHRPALPHPTSDELTFLN